MGVPLIYGAYVVGSSLVVFLMEACASHDGQKNDLCKECHTSPNELPVAFFQKYGKIEEIGAHKFHLNPRWSEAVPCFRCHHEVTEATRYEHALGNENDVIINGFVGSDGRVEIYDATAKSCQVYCHGHQEMSWNKEIQTSELECLSCHESDTEDDVHIKGDTEKCGTCHPFDQQSHVNGGIEVVTIDLTEENTCLECHDAEDEVHQTHRAPQNSTPKDCRNERCHVAVGGELSLSEHFLDPEKGIRINGRFPGEMFNAVEHSCQIACHGESHLMVWRPTVLDCNSCHEPTTPAHDVENCSICHPNIDAEGRVIDRSKHGDFEVQRIDNVCIACHDTPPANHSGRTVCGECHTSVPETPFRISETDPHRNGQADIIDDNENIDENATCSSCHASMPPADSFHDIHLNSLLIFPEITCSECHADIDIGELLRHLDPANAPFVAFSGRALKRDGDGIPFADKLASYDPVTKTCNNTNCHDSENLSERSVNVVPAVDMVGSGMSCWNGCHNSPPSGEIHDSLPSPIRETCSSCHIDPKIDASRHIDEAQQIDFK